MKKRFIYELGVGTITLVAVLLFANLGMVAFALLAAHPFIGKKHSDERERLLFNQVGNITAGVTLLACIVISYASDASVNGHLIGEFWLGLVCGSFLVAHGGAGLFTFRNLK